jgi:hypothetical protein
VFSPPLGKLKQNHQQPPTPPKNIPHPQLLVLPLLLLVPVEEVAEAVEAVVVVADVEDSNTHKPLAHVWMKTPCRLRQISSNIVYNWDHLRLLVLIYILRDILQMCTDRDQPRHLNVNSLYSKNVQIYKVVYPDELLLPF